jgi:hypothetical protein
MEVSEWGIFSCIHHCGGFFFFHQFCDVPEVVKVGEKKTRILLYSLVPVTGTYHKNLAIWIYFFVWNLANFVHFFKKKLKSFV